MYPLSPHLGRKRSAGALDTLLLPILCGHDWQYGQNKIYPNEKQHRFEWGTVKIQYEIEDDCIKNLVIYTDALNTESIEKIPQLLIGKKISDIETDNDYIELNDIIGLLKEKEKNEI